MRIGIMANRFVLVEHDRAFDLQRASRAVSRPIRRDCSTRGDALVEYAGTAGPNGELQDSLGQRIDMR
jgi:hypothetical protein